MNSDLAGKFLRKWLILAAALLAFLFLMQVAGIHCFIRFMTGVSCPGCGMTRAWIAFLTGHMARAFSCHPLFWTVPFAGLYVLWRDWKITKDPASRSRFKTPDRLILALFALAFFICYGLRMADSGDTIVVCHLSEGIYFRLFSLFGIFK